MKSVRRPEGKRGRRGGQEGDGAGRAGPGGRTWACTPGRWASCRAVIGGGTGPDSDAHVRPLVVVSGEDRLWGTRAEALGSRGRKMMV